MSMAAPSPGTRHAGVSVPLAIALAASVVVVSGVTLVYPVLPVIAADLGISQSRIGLVIAAFAMPAIILAPLAGFIADLYGRRWLLICGLTLFSLAGLASAFAPTFEWLLACRVVQGIGMSALSPLTIVLLSDVCRDREHELEAQGWKVAIDRVAMIVLPLIGGTLALYGWQLVFVLFALVLPISIMAFLLMPETKTPGQVEIGSYVRNTIEALQIRAVSLAFAVGFLRFFLDYGFFVYLPLYLSLRYEASVVVSGVMLAIAAVGAIVTAVTVRRLSAYASLERLLSMAFLISGCGLALIVAQPPLWFIAVGTFLIGLGNGLISPLQKSMITRNAPPALRGGVISCDRMVQQIAKSLAPALLGVLLVFAPLEAVLLMLLIVCVIGTVMMRVAERSGKASPKQTAS